MGIERSLSAALDWVVSLIQPLGVLFWILLPWLGTLFVGVLAAWLNYHFRAQGRIREAHHAEIKANVLKPLLEWTNSLLAILEQRRPPVGRLPIVQNAA